MRDFFRRFPGAIWDRQQRLHVYALPTDDLRQVVEQYHAAIADIAAEHGLGLQPPQWLHLTVQMFHTTLADIPPQRLDELVDKLTAATTPLPRMQLRIGVPQVGAHSVELAVEPTADDQWSRTVHAVRDAADAVLGSDALPDLGSNRVPHTSIGYGIGNGDSGELMSALKRIRLPPVAVDIDELHLVAVHQHPDRGCYTWDYLAKLPLAA